jgi:hypothetical protein
MSKRDLRTLLLLLLVAGNVSAQELPGVPAADEAAAAGPWTWFGDFMLREDRVTDIPRPTDTSFTRTFGRGRFGVLYDPIPALELGAAIKLADASNSNDLDRSHNNNERSNDIAIDQFFLRWASARMRACCSARRNSAAACAVAVGQRPAPGRRERHRVVPRQRIRPAATDRWLLYRQPDVRRRLAHRRGPGRPTTGTKARRSTAACWFPTWHFPVSNS